MNNTQSTTATNITGSDLTPATAKNNAPKYFNNFYATPFNVSSGTNDAIVAFFEKYTQNAIAGKNMASAVLYTAMAQNIDPMSVLSEFQNLPKGELNSYIAAFLNISRAPTSSLGINNGTKTTSTYITRSIIL